MLKKKNIRFLVVHCSDTPDDSLLTARDIHNMHLSFGWNGIGYHKIICRNGLVESGRPEYWVGAHVYGKNHESLGVCLIGRNNFSQEQFISLKKVLLDWKDKYRNTKILGHYETIITSKTCPNFDVQKWLVSENLNDKQ